MINKHINSSIQKGVEFLDKTQKENGGFVCLTSIQFDNYKDAKKVPAIVSTNIVLSSLIHLKETDKVKEVKNKAAKFLLSQKSNHWSFNYWFRDSKEYKKIPYPDDLDDTFCALAALYEHNSKIFDGNVMGKIINMLTIAEEKEGGPYNMWLTPRNPRATGEKWHDIDLVVNSNVAFFLYLNNITLPKLNAFIEKSVDENDYEFPYNTIYPCIYFIFCYLIIFAKQNRIFTSHIGVRFSERQDHFLH